MNNEIEMLHPLVLNVGYAVHNADWNWTDVRSPFMRIYYVTGGSARVQLPGGIIELKPHHLYFIPSFTTHSYICDSYFSLYYIHLYEDNQGGHSLLDDWVLPNEISACEHDLDLVKKLCEINPFMKLPESNPDSYDNNPMLMKSLMVNKSRAVYDKVESRGIVYILLSRFLKHAAAAESVKDERIERVLDYIRNHIYENISVRHLAASVFLSEDHFIKLFKQEMCSTPLQYINSKKIEKAQLLLVTENVSVKNIAYRLSFDDYSYFCRIFKKIAGVTPNEYRFTVK